MRSAAECICAAKEAAGEQHPKTPREVAQQNRRIAAEGEERRGSLEPGQWHAVVIRVRGQAVEFLLDGKPATGGTQQAIPVLCASAHRTGDGSAMVLRLVNNGPLPLDTLIDLGAVKPAGTAEGWILSHANPEASNTVDQPDAVTPQSLRWENVEARHNRLLPAYSLSVVRIPLHQIAIRWGR